MTESVRGQNVWGRRWQALEKVLRQYKDWFTSQELDKKIPSCGPMLGTLICELSQHTRICWEDFYAGFSIGGYEDTDPENGLKYPAEYVYHLLLERISTDLEIIQKIVGQRLSSPPEVQKTLEKADELALSALQLAKDCGMLEKGSSAEATAVTYFEKVDAIRVIPYAPVALIGIPYTCINYPPDYLAIPHEIGHYVFWQGKKGNSYLCDLIQKDLKDLGNWCDRWAEEIFADVYGCLVAGPAITQDFMDLQRVYPDEQFLVDDDEHPVPAIRPYIYTQVLAQCFGNEYPELHESWDNELTGKVTQFLSKDKQPRWIKSFNPPQGDALYDKSLSKAVEVMLSYFNSLATHLAERRLKGGDWLGYLNVDGSDWYERFQKYICLDAPSDPVRIPTSATSSPKFKNWSKRLYDNGWVTRGPHDPIPK